MVGPAQLECGEKTMTCERQKMSLRIVKVLPGSLLTITGISEDKYYSPLKPSRALKCKRG